MFPRNRAPASPHCQSTTVGQHQASENHQQVVAWLHSQSLTPGKAGEGCEGAAGLNGKVQGPGRPRALGSTSWGLHPYVGAQRMSRSQVVTRPSSPPPAAPAPTMAGARHQAPGLGATRSPGDGEDTTAPPAAASKKHVFCSDTESPRPASLSLSIFERLRDTSLPLPWGKTAPPPHTPSPPPYPTPLLPSPEVSP